MHCFSLFADTGNLMGWWYDRDEALGWLVQTVREDPSNAEGYALFEYDEEGEIVGEVIFGSSVLREALAPQSGGGG
jgi:uncharacterized protein YuzE